MAKRGGRRRSSAVRTAAGNRGKPFVVGPMNFGMSQIGWGASASPAARAMGVTYGQIPRNVVVGNYPGGRMGGGLPGNPGITGSYKKILNPWGNNVPKWSATRANGIGQSPAYGRVKPLGGRKSAAQDPNEIRIDYPANDPRFWPIAGGKIVIWEQAAKANQHNTIVDRAFARGGYALQQSFPTFSGSDVSYAEATAWYTPWSNTSPADPMTP